MIFSPSGHCKMKDRVCTLTPPVTSLLSSQCLEIFPRLNDEKSSNNKKSIWLLEREREKERKKLYLTIWWCFKHHLVTKKGSIKAQKNKTDHLPQVTDHKKECELFKTSQDIHPVCRLHAHYGLKLKLFLLEVLEHLLAISGSLKIIFC